MRLILLTRTSRPSGAIVAKSLIDAKKNLVAIIAEDRSELLKKKGSQSFVLLNSLRQYGFNFTVDKIRELLNIKLHFLLRKILTSKAYRNKNYLSIEELVLDYKIPLFLVKDHNSKDCETIIKSLQPDLIVLTNTRIIRENILQIPSRGAINLHGSLLPKYAGLYSMFWALFHGEKEVGVTVHMVTDELDRGDIILQEKIAVNRCDDENKLYKKALDISAKIILEAISLIEQNKVILLKQDLGLASKFSWPTKQQRQELKKRLKLRSKSAEGPVKVLHIITRLIKGGAQENTLLTVLGLRDKGYDVMLASGPTYGREGEIESCVRKQGVNLIIIPELVRDPHLWKDLVSFIKIYLLIRRYNFDIVHTHTSKAGILARIAAKLACVPAVVHTPHGHVFHDYFGPLKTTLFHILEVLCAPFCDKIITLTDRCKEDHIKFKIAKADKFVTIPSGVCLDRFTNRVFEVDNIKARLNIPSQRKIAGTVARLEPVKGVQVFLEATQEILSQVPEAHFLIVGDGSLRPRLEARAKALGVENNITFTGTRDDIPELISIMDLFVLSSLNEGMGRVLVEAGIMSKPIVATRVSGIPELVEDGYSGVLIDSCNTKQLARSAVDLLSNPDKAKRLGDNARLKMQDRFSAEIMVDKISNLYQGLLGLT